MKSGEAVELPPATKGAIILLIEDEPAVARLTELVLVNAGYTVHVLADHTAAPGFLAENAYHLVIADTDLGPHTAGLDGLAPLVRAAPCPVVLFTAHRFPEAQVKAAGFAGVIRKPFDIDDLLAVVAGALASETFHAPNGNQITPV